MRILIATVTAGAGHLHAAAALEEVWRAFRPRDTVQRVDVLDYTPRFYKKAYAEGYVKLIAHAPELYALAFRKTDDPALIRRLTRLRRALSPLPARRFVRFLKEFEPDAVLCTHFLPLEILGGLRSRSRRGEEAEPAEQESASSPPPHVGGYPFTVCIVTDFEAHALWMEPAVDLYCVAAEETKVRLVARGVSPKNVIATGIPISARFSRKPDVTATRKQLGLRDDLPTLLVLSGGFGMGPVGQILAELDKVRRAIQVVVVCGRNEELRRDLAGRGHRHPTQVLGFVTNMHELMAASELVITKPGGLTTSEALAIGKPMVIINPIPGQEAANADFLLEHGAAIRLNSVEDLPFRIEQLLGTRKLAAMARAAKSLGRLDAARRICEQVVARIGRGPEGGRM